MKTITLFSIAFGILGCTTPVPSCDVPQNHLCYEVNDTETSVRESCTALAGTVGTGCTRTKATGGCQKDVSGSAGAPVAQVTWSYADSPADEMITEASCTANGGVYVVP